MSNDLVATSGTEIAPYVSDASHVLPRDALSQADTARDEELFGSFQLTLSSHGVNDPRAVSAARAWYAEFSKSADRLQAKQDERDIRACLKALRGTWGADYTANMRLLNEMMDELPEDVALPLYEGRDADGVHLLNKPALVNFLVTAKRAIDTPPVAWQRTSTEATELEQIKQLMGNPRSDYWRGPRAAKLQARYLELIGGG